MAQINMSINELIYIIKQNIDKLERLRDISITGDRQVELTISLNQFFPNIKTRLIYERFSEGKIYLKLEANGSTKAVLGLLSELYRNQNKDEIMKFAGQSVVFDINKALANNLNGVMVKDLSIRGREIHIEVGPPKRS